MRIELKNGYPGVLFLERLNGAKRNAMLPSQQDRNLVGGENISDRVSYGIYHLSRAARIGLQRRQGINAGQISLFAKLLIVKLHLARSLQNGMRPSPRPGLIR